MKARRPFLILGDALRQFLADRATGAKVALRPRQFYCFTCKAGREPMGKMVDCIPQTPKTARLLGLCEVCGCTFNRMISRSEIEQFGQIFELVTKDGKTP